MRTTSYGLPKHLHDHIDVIQPTTMFGRFKQFKSTIVKVDKDVAQPQTNAAAIVDTVSGLKIDSECSQVVTITCLQQLYNTVGVAPSAPNNSIAVTGFLVSIYFDSIDALADPIQGQIANVHDLQLFYADQRKDALGSNFTFVSVNGNFTEQVFNCRRDLYSFSKALSTIKQNMLPVVKPTLMYSLLLASLIQFQ